MMAYGTGAATGSSAVETMTLGNPPISVPKQPFGIVLDASHDFRATSCDGLVGLGLDALSVMRKVPVFTNMVKQNLIENNVFAWWLSNDPAREPAGKLTLGGVDPSLYVGEMTWAPVATKGYWTVQLNGMRHSGGNGTLVEAAKNATAEAATTGAEAAAAAAATTETTESNSTSPSRFSVPLNTSRAILDSGTTAIIVTRRDAAAIHAGIKGIKLLKVGFFAEFLERARATPLLPPPTKKTHLYSFLSFENPNALSLSLSLSLSVSLSYQGGYYNVTGGCSTVDDLPDMVFVINGTDYAVPPRLWTQRIPAKKGEDPEKMCISAILPGPTTPEKGMILGDAFMRQWYTAYERDAEGNARVGFALSAKGPDVPAASLAAVAPPPTSSK